MANENNPDGIDYIVIREITEDTRTTAVNEREQYYDEQIAPRLREIAELCKAKDMPMLAAVYFNGEDSGVTQVPPDKPLDHPPWFLLMCAWKARGNIDAMCMSLARTVPVERDGSIALRTFRHAR